jgi:hypothetical protein
MLQEEMSKINMLQGTQSLMPLPSEENKLDNNDI